MQFLLSAILLAASATSAVAQSQSAGLPPDAIKCGPGNKCPDESPCCSQYGQCGIGAYCLGGCDPRFSKSIDSCVAAPQCSDKTLKMNSLDGIEPNSKFLGDASKADWVSSGEPQVFDNAVLLTMPQDSVGTLLASTEYIWYGKVSAKMKTSRGQGVVTAFILLSDVQDEIDFEFVGKELDTAQTNYYFQGQRNYDNGDKSPASNTNEEWHTYEIDWTPQKITWSIDGDEVRTLDKTETMNKTTNQYNYPQTPSRLQLSLWPGGAPSNGKGTIEWAGGPINWDSEDISQYGYYYAQVSDITIQCYDPPSDAKGSGSTSYTYSAAPFLENDVSLSSDKTVLKSLLGSGTNMSADYEDEDDAEATASGTDTPKPKQTKATIPGLTQAGPGTDGSRPGSGDDGSSGDTASSGGSGGSGGSSDGSGAGSGAQTTAQGGFSQGGPSGNNAAASGEKIMQGSLFAGLVAVAGMLLL
ncbi:MAG: hypothetical protein M1825_002859 [Sarcosagium campestre]|nr:MAG: hypothetical protein M1825_002859 [Sarcosagium campestre]